MDIANWIQSIGILITLISLIIVVMHNRKQLQVFNEQLKLNFFADYTKRYQEIILNLPDNISHPDFDYSKLQEEVRSRTMRYMRALIYVAKNMICGEQDMFMTEYGIIGSRALSLRFQKELLEKLGKDLLQIQCIILNSQHG